jgi:hypothetical protein
MFTTRLMSQMKQGRGSRNRDERPTFMNVNIEFCNIVDIGRAMTC